VDHAKRWFSRLLSPRPKGAAPDDMLRDRCDAGRRLAAVLMRFKSEQPVVLALPRGGVPVGFEVAQALGAPLDVVLVRKIGAPGQPELGIGAIVDGSEPRLVLNDEMVRLVQPEADYVEAEHKRQRAELERRRQLYRGARPPAAVEGRTVIVVDDGIATGGSVKAVLQALAHARPARLVLAVPVAPQDSLDAIAAAADEVVCLARPDPFFAVGAHYRDFTQTTDDEVVALLRQAAMRTDRGSE
jgi:putative phosphoribosyl transferase